MPCIENFIAQAKKQQWSTSLCHSPVPHTYMDRSLRYKIMDNILMNHGYLCEQPPVNKTQ